MDRLSSPGPVFKGYDSCNTALEPSLAKSSSDGFRISLDDNLKLVSCNRCHRKLLESALITHLETCPGTPRAYEPPKPPQKQINPKPSTQTPPAPSPILLKKPVKKRKADPNSKIKLESKKPKTSPALNLDVQCGAPVDGGKCSRSIACKMVLFLANLACCYGEKSRCRKVKYL